VFSAIITGLPLSTSIVTTTQRMDLTFRDSHQRSFVVTATLLMAQ